VKLGLLQIGADTAAHSDRDLRAIDASAFTQRRLAKVVDWVVGHCAKSSVDDQASRILITGGEDRVQPIALTVARALGVLEDGTTLLVDTSQSAAAISSLIELPRAHGLAELCQGKADFDSVIRRDRESPCHFLGSGFPRSVGGPWGRPGAADAVFRALDETYRWIVFCAEVDEALGLANNMKRQFAACVIVEDKQMRQHPFLTDAFAQHGFPIYRLAASRSD